MSRIRSIHPKLFTDDEFMGLPGLARILLIGLWTEADDQGVFEWKPRTMKARILPTDECDTEALLASLATARFIQRFEHSGNSWGAVRNFRKFQRPQKPTAINPLPDELRSYVCLEPITTVALPESSLTPTVKPPQMEDGGDKREKEESKREAAVAAPAPKPSPKGTRLEPEWRPNAEGCDLARTLSLDLEAILADFRDYWIALPGSKGLKLDWHRTWAKWCRKQASDFVGQGQRRRVGREPASMASILAEAAARHGGGRAGSFEDDPHANDLSAGGGEAGSDVSGNSFSPIDLGPDSGGDCDLPIRNDKPPEGRDRPETDGRSLAAGIIDVPAGHRENRAQVMVARGEMVADTGGDHDHVPLEAGAQAADLSALGGVDIPPFLRRF